MSHRIAALLIANVLAFTALAVRVQPAQPDPWFERMVALATAADKAYDEEIAASGTWTCEAAIRLAAKDCVEPKTDEALQFLFLAIAKQIGEETGLTARIPAVTLFNFWANSPVGLYDPSRDTVGLNPRYIIDAGWRNNDMSWLGTLVHEFVHAQGLWAGPSEFLEAETETTTFEVLAALANRNFPGARAELMRGIRSDALWVVWWIAQGRPVLTSIHDNGYFVCNLGPQCAHSVNDGQMKRWTDLRASLMSPFELRRADQLFRWWRTQPNLTFEGVLYRYVVPVLIPSYLAACGSGVLAEKFEMVQRRELPEFIPPFIPLGADYVHTWGPLKMDDLAYVFAEIGACD